MKILCWEKKQYLNLFYSLHLVNQDHLIDFVKTYRSLPFSMSVFTRKETMLIFREPPIHNAIPLYNHQDSQEIRHDIKLMRQSM